MQQFYGIGINMMLAAVELSRNEGFHGRIGLHALSQAASFYANTCGMSALGRDRHYDDLDFFEMTLLRPTPSAVRREPHSPPHQPAHPMKITVTKDWFHSRAYLEEGHEIGAGSMRHIGKPALSALPTNTTTENICFGRTIALMRRHRRWTKERLATEAEASPRGTGRNRNQPLLRAGTDHCFQPRHSIQSLRPGIHAESRSGGSRIFSPLRRQHSLRGLPRFPGAFTPDEEYVLQAVLKALIEHPEV